MTETGLSAFDTTLHKTHEWLHGIMARMRTEDRQMAYSALRAPLHALRDLLPLTEVVGLGAQMPTLIRGVYYEGWQPSLEVAPGTKFARLLDARRAFVPADSSDPAPCGEFGASSARSDE